MRRLHSPAPRTAPGAHALALLALTLLAAAALPDRGPGQGGDEAPWQERLADDGRAPRLEDLEGDTCIPCHREIGEEWVQSLHAMAWVDPHYTDALKKIRRKKGCWGCHAPRDLSVLGLTEEGLPEQAEVREGNRHLGVHCTSCHLAADGETVLGPAGRETDAHPTRESVLFDHDENDALCIACHDTTIGPVIGIARDFVDTDQKGLDLSCVGCHMPAARRPWANREEGEEGEAYPTRRGRSHRLETARDPLFLREAFRVVKEEGEGGPGIRIENQCGHRVPGLNSRTIRFEARLVDGSGEELAKAEATIDHRSFLPVEESLLLQLGTVKGAAAIELEGWHTTPGVSRPFTFLEERFELD